MMLPMHEERAVRHEHEHLSLCPCGAGPKMIARRGAQMKENNGYRYEAICAYYVLCPDCGLRGPTYRARYKAVRGWNYE